MVEYICCSAGTKNFGRRMEEYRSGHNGPHSKCGSPKGLVGSNPTSSANNGMWLSLVEHYVRDVGAAGSNPVIPTKTARKPDKACEFFVAKRESGNAARSSNPVIPTIQKSSVEFYCISALLLSYIEIKF